MPLIIAYHSSRPVIQLLAAVSGKNKAADKSQHFKHPLRGEYRYILDVLESKGIELESYQQTLTQQTQQMQYYVLSSLLEGTADALESEELATRYFHEFWKTGKESFFMLLIRIWTDSTSEYVLSQPLVESLLRSSLPPNSLHHIIHNSDGEKLEYESIVIVRANSTNNIWTREKCAAAVKDVMSNLPDAAFRFAVSDIHTGLREIRDVYTHLRYLLRLPAGNTDSVHVIIWPSLDSSNKNVGELDKNECWKTLPAISNASVYRLLLNGQYSTLKSLLDECEEYIHADSPVEENVICYVFYSCTSALYKLLCNIPVISDIRSEPLFVPAYNSHCDTDTLFSQLRNALLEACLSIQSYYSDSGEKHARDIVSFYR